MVQAHPPAGLGLPVAGGGGGDLPSRIRLDSHLKRWFSRNLGLWRSRRQLFFADDTTLQLDMLLRVEAFSEDSGAPFDYRFTWWPQRQVADRPAPEGDPTPGGTMLASLCGHQLHCRRGSPGAAASRSQIRQVDEHELVFEAHGPDWTTLEHIRLVDQDRYRARSIYTWRHGRLELAETHHEIRLEGPGVPIPSAG